MKHCPDLENRQSVKEGPDKQEEKDDLGHMSIALTPDGIIVEDTKERCPEEVVLPPMAKKEEPRQEAVTSSKTSECVLLQHYFS